MTDDQFNHQQNPTSPINNGVQSGQTQTGSLQKEQESLPSASANFSELELPAESNSEPEPQISENTSTGSTQSSPPASSNSTNVASHPQAQTQSSKSSHMQHVLTKEQAQQIVKGPLMFKNSSDPMLWLAFLLLRHYQLLEEEEKISNKE